MKNITKESNDMHEHSDKDLINKERTWKNVICLNPDHDTMEFRTNRIGNIHCPICDMIMVVVVKFNGTLIDFEE